MICSECGAEDSRATPLIDPEYCLKNHTQYICGSCGRCICIECDPKRGLRRWNFPFKSLENAKLYLRTADCCVKKSCSIYKIKSGGRISYKIFPGENELSEYLKRNKGKVCNGLSPVFAFGEYKEFEGAQVRRLTEKEAEKYLSEKRCGNISGGNDTTSDNIRRLMKERFGHDCVISLATYDGVPHVRMVNGYYEDSCFYVITHALSGKMRQLEVCPKAAVAGEWFTGHGIGENLGWIKGEKNLELWDRLYRVFSQWIGNGHTDLNDENTVILRIRLTDGVLLSHGMRYEAEFPL